MSYVLAHVTTLWRKPRCPHFEDEQTEIRRRSQLVQAPTVETQPDASRTDGEFILSGFLLRMEFFLSVSCRSPRSCAPLCSSSHVVARHSTPRHLAVPPMSAPLLSSPPRRKRSRGRPWGGVGSHTFVLYDGLEFSSHNKWSSLSVP